MHGQHIIRAKKFFKKQPVFEKVGAVKKKSGVISMKQKRGTLGALSSFSAGIPLHDFASYQSGISFSPACPLPAKNTTCAPSPDHRSNNATASYKDKVRTVRTTVYHK